MPVVSPIHTVALSQVGPASEFKKKIWKLIGEKVEQLKMMNQDVLVATYIESERSAGGILKPQKSVSESLYQGRAGLVLRAGPIAFKYDESGCAWEGPTPKVNDWIVFRYSDAWEIHLGGVSCRVIDSRMVRGIVDNPEIIF